MFVPHTYLARFLKSTLSKRLEDAFTKTSCLAKLCVRTVGLWEIYRALSHRTFISRNRTVLVSITSGLWRSHTSSSVQQDSTICTERNFLRVISLRGMTHMNSLGLRLLRLEQILHLVLIVLTQRLPKLDSKSVHLTVTTTTGTRRGRRSTRGVQFPLRRSEILRTPRWMLRVSE